MDVKAGEEGRGGEEKYLTTSRRAAIRGFLCCYRGGETARGRVASGCGVDKGEREVGLIRSGGEVHFRCLAFRSSSIFCNCSGPACTGGRTIAPW